MPNLKPETQQRLQTFMESPDFAKLKPETQQRLQSALMQNQRPEIQANFPVEGRTDRGIQGKDYFIPQVARDAYSFVTGKETAKPLPGQQTLYGDIFSRPAAANREAMRANPLLRYISPPLSGAIAATGLAGEKAKKAAREAAGNPETSETFQSERIRQTQPFQSPMLNAITGQYGSIAGMVEDVLSNPADLLMALIPETKTAKEISRIAASSKPGKFVSKVANKNIGKPRATAKNLDAVIDYSIDKGLSPRIPGKKKYAKYDQFKKNSRDAVKSIVENKKNLQFTTDNGDVVGELPQSLGEMMEATRQTKRAIYKQIDQAKKAADGQGVIVDVRPAVRGIKMWARRKANKATNPNMVSIADEMADNILSQGPYTASQLDDVIKTLNSDLQPFYSSMSEAKAGQAKALLAKGLRKKLDQAVSNVTGVKYQALKNKYGALKSIEDDLVKMSIVDARKKNAGFFSYADVVGAGNIVEGLLAKDPSRMLKGLAQKKVGEYLKSLNDPNKYIKSMFQVADKFHVPKPLPAYIPTRTAEVISDIPVNSQPRIGQDSRLMLENQLNVPTPSTPLLPNQSGSFPIGSTVSGQGFTVSNPGGLQTGGMGVPLRSSPIQRNIQITPEAQNLLTYDPTVGRGNRFGKWFTVRQP